MKLGHRAFSHVPASVLAILACGVPAHFVIAADGDPTVEGYRTRQQELLDSQQTILARADAEGRELTVEERNEVGGLAAEFERLGGEIELRERTAAQAAALSAPRGRQADPDPINPEPAPPAPSPRAANSQRPVDGVHRVPAQPKAPNGMFGFRNFGEFARAVKAANPKFGGETDKRLLLNAAASTYGNEGTGQDGGFLVPPDMRSDIMQRVFSEDSLVGRTDRQRSSSNTITFPADMTTPWGTTGIQAYWTGEGATKTQSKPAFENVTVKAHTLAALIPVTEELLEDAPALDGYLRSKTPEIMDFKISDAIIRGTGVGQPLGILNSPALVTVSKEAGPQTADTIVAANIAKMFGRMPVRNRATAVWLMNPDVEAQLPLMTLGQQPIYLPPGGLSGSSFGTLLGRPVIPHQAMETIGDLGDIGFFDFNAYLTLTKTGGGRDSNGMRADVSIHLWFDQDLVAYRFTIRLGGQPWWSAAITPRDGNNSLSPFIILEAR